MPRLGPAESATQFVVGTRKRGQDGNMWIIVKAINGVKRWQRIKSAKPAEPKPVVRIPAEVENKQHNILLCEPATYNGAEWYTKKLTVDDIMYKKILRGPKIYRTNRTNAYVFGKRYPLKEYKLIGSHGNDVAQTGFIDLDLIKKLSDGTPTTKGKGRQKGKTFPDIYEIMKPFYYIKGKSVSYDDRKAFAELHKIAPYVIFVGETVGGDVGANLFAHYTDGVIDSLIIDNGYFFQDK
jgi:hypothetical protein